MKRYSMNWFVVTAMLIAVGVFTSTYVRAVLYVPESEVEPPSTQVTRTDETILAPTRLVIPRLHLSADVQHVGINQEGNMAAPSNYTDVSWYRYGSVPGEAGSAVMAGHVDDGLGLAGVFKELHELKRGDLVYVVTRDGKELTFEVQELVRYRYTDVPADLLFSRADTARLNLITCSGRWVSTDHTYGERLVVYTRLISS